MNSDPLARSYRWFEYAAFGHRLERHRFHFLPLVGSAEYALVLGDGDGRFLTRLAADHPNLQIDCIENSRAMIEQSQRRLRQASIPHLDRIRFHCADARTCPLSNGRYDLVVSQFFLDCFTTADVERLCTHIGAACREDARWLISDFQQPSHGWPAWHARLWLTTMYTFFRIATGLEVSALPQYSPALRQAGFQCRARYTSMAGLIASEFWSRSSANIA